MQVLQHDRASQHVSMCNTYISPTAQHDCASQYECLSSKYQSKLRSTTVPVSVYIMQVPVQLRSTTVPVSVYIMQIPVQLRSTTVSETTSQHVYRLSGVYMYSLRVTQPYTPRICIHVLTTWHTTIHTTYRYTCIHYVGHNHTHHVYVYMY